MLTIDEGSELAEALESVVLWRGFEATPSIALTYLILGAELYKTVACGLRNPPFKCAFCKDMVARDVGRWLRERFASA